MLSERLISFLCSRLRDTSGQLESIALHPMHVRLARFFLVAIGDRKPVPGKRLPLDIGMSQGELDWSRGFVRRLRAGAYELVGDDTAHRRDTGHKVPD